MGYLVLLLQKIQCLVLPEVLISLANIQMVMMRKLTNENHKVFYSVASVHNVLIDNKLIVVCEDGLIG